MESNPKGLNSGAKKHQQKAIDTLKIIKNRDIIYQIQCRI